MPFSLLNEPLQKRFSTAKNGLSLFIFVAGLLITAFLANAFHQSELKLQHESLTSQAREFYKIQNLTLNNNILKIQSFNELLNRKYNGVFNDSLYEEHVIKNIFNNVSNEFMKTTILSDKNNGGK